MELRIGIVALGDIKPQPLVLRCVVCVCNLSVT